MAMQLEDNPDVLGHLVAHIAGRIAPEEHAALTGEVLDWLRRNIPSDYRWPGNIRELEQCVRNIMIRGQYQPATAAANDSQSPAQSLAEQIQSVSLTADELVSRYCKIAYQQTRNLSRAAKLLQLDRRTVRAKVDFAEDAQPA
jgi:DNA-binding NtrC family response regulator